MRRADKEKRRKEGGKGGKGQQPKKAAPKKAKPKKKGSKKRRRSKKKRVSSGTGYLHAQETLEGRPPGQQGGRKKEGAKPADREDQGKPNFEIRVLPDLHALAGGPSPSKPAAGSNGSSQPHSGTPSKPLYRPDEMVRCRGTEGCEAKVRMGEPRKQAARAIKFWILRDVVQGLEGLENLGIESVEEIFREADRLLEQDCIRPVAVCPACQKRLAALFNVPTRDLTVELPWALAERARHPLRQQYRAWKPAPAEEEYKPATVEDLVGRFNAIHGKKP